MKDKKDKEGRLIFKNGELIMIHEKEPVIQVGTETIVLRKPIHKN